MKVHAASPRFIGPGARSALRGVGALVVAEVRLSLRTTHPVGLTLGAHGVGATEVVEGASSDNGKADKTEDPLHRKSPIPFRNGLSKVLNHIDKLNAIVYGENTKKPYAYGIYQT